MAETFQDQSMAAPSRPGVCAKPTKSYPDGRTGTVAGHRAHGTIFETPCEACRIAINEHQTKRRHEQPIVAAKTKASNKQSQQTRSLKYKYGISMDQYRQRLVEQNGRCAACGSLDPGKDGRFHVDHDHSCCPGARCCGSCIRGLLCWSCNVGMGVFHDDIDRLTAAIAYLMAWQGAKA